MIRSGSGARTNMIKIRASSPAASFRGSSSAGERGGWYSAKKWRGSTTAKARSGSSTPWSQATGASSGRCRRTKRRQSSKPGTPPGK